MYDYDETDDYYEANSKMQGWAVWGVMFILVCALVALAVF
jgi:hypothetical protein